MLTSSFNEREIQRENRTSALEIIGGTGLVLAGVVGVAFGSDTIKNGFKSFTDYLTVLGGSAVGLGSFIIGNGVRNYYDLVKDLTKRLRRDKTYTDSELARTE